MSISEIAAIIGAITGVISIFGIIYAYGFKFGSIETKLRNIEKNQINPIEFGKLSNQVETIYKVYVLDSLSKRENTKNSSENPKNNPGPNPENNDNQETLEFPHEILNLIHKETFKNIEKEYSDIVSTILAELGASGSKIFLDFAKELSPKHVIIRIFEEVAKIKAEGKEILKKIDDFREERLIKLRKNETPKPFHEGGKIVIHLLPFESFPSEKHYDLSVFKGQYQVIKPMRFHAYDQEFNFDGLLHFCVGADRKCLDYVQVYTDGKIEVVDGYYLSYNDRKELPIFSIEEDIIKSTKECLLFQEKLGIYPPLIFYLALLGAKGFSIRYGKIDDFFDNIHPIDREDLILPRIFIHNFDVNLENILKTSFDRIWNACGYPRSYHYNEKGEWIKK